MHHSQNGNSQPGIPLAYATPSAQSCTISELMAFPSSLTALKQGVKWNASCWVANQRLNEFEQEQIRLYAFSGQQRTPHIEWCQFATDIHDTVSMLIVFPELKTSFRSPEIMQRWTDDVVLPAFRAHGIAGTTLTSNFNIIQMTAEAERQQTLNDFAPDTILTEVLRKNGGLSSQDVHDLWSTIHQNANRTVFFDGFKNLFLVVIYRPPTRSIQTLPLDEAWKAFSSTWDEALDMTYIPTETVRADAQVTISAHHMGTQPTTSANVQRPTPTHWTTADSIWESSRKRRIDRDDDVEKRSKPNDDVSQGSMTDDISMQL